MNELEARINELARKVQYNQECYVQQRDCLCAVIDELNKLKPQLANLQAGFTQERETICALIDEINKVSLIVNRHVGD